MKLIWIRNFLIKAEEELKHAETQAREFLAEEGEAEEDIEDEIAIIKVIDWSVSFILWFDVSIYEFDNEKLLIRIMCPILVAKEIVSNDVWQFNCVKFIVRVGKMHKSKDKCNLLSCTLYNYSMDLLSKGCSQV